MKRALPIKKVSADLDVLRFPTAQKSFVRPLCLNCPLPLTLLQPELNLPDRLLGVCSQCHHWFLVHLVPDETEGLLWRLPDVELIRQLSADKPPKGSSRTTKSPKS